MTVEVKICGLNDPQAVAMTVAAGARYAGFVFYRRSPRVVENAQAASLIASLSPAVTPVGLFVDPSDDDIQNTLRHVPLRLIQLHGAETPQRVAAVKSLTGLPVIKAVGIATVSDIVSALTFESVADMLLLDAKPQAGQVPGGNGVAFDWALLKNAPFARPWFLAGGLTPANVAAAIVATGATKVDVSSGVESAPGHKDIAKIQAFIAATRG